MSEHKLVFAIYGNAYKRQAILPFIERAVAYLESHHATPLVEPENIEGVDYVISMGGDGTFLEAANKVGDREIPILGVNMGRLGFLADVLPSEIETTLDHVLRGDHIIEDHTVIKLETNGETVECNPFALNDIAVLKRDSASMISIRAYVNGDFLVNYQADGLIIATPTGSTAYSLSNGGPIIVPQSGSLCITPVAPHSLNIRPIVINDTSVIELEVCSRSHNFLVAVDGRSMKMAEETRLTIRKAPYTIKLIKLKSQRYFSTLHEKLMWGADTRQR
ncbi:MULTISPECIES: NAD kinase [Prevotellaceae]|jgi:probable inorganic polyphosphate/ATP-NAD kinase|uniref:NAD kinase n=2 Tax=Segatella oris TaxID=28135 RepID=A0A448L4T5_9BACT|nr:MULTISPECIES: NAD kinase [Prevotellaceae]EFI47864.1 ATP-NAD kinase [Segatella oris C735]OFO74621.1 NAD kinase [Prevotella sp. HMSC077E08]OFP60264.1 NAD kinase [Prevotella sp. HMSC077E09]VEH14983.1 Probable inorganic polyphosphate/ATP-NAD kinase [Segatella oris]